MSSVAVDHGLRPRPAGFVADVITIAGRAVRDIPHEPAPVLAAVLVPAFFFFVNTGSLQRFAAQHATHAFNFKAFYLPVSIVFAVSSSSRAATLVTDIQSGYFDRLCVTPIRRSALLIGMMFADFLLALGLATFVLLIGLAAGIRFETGVAGFLPFIVIGGLWGLSFAGVFYAVALKTGNPAAVNSATLLFVPFAFLTTALTPKIVMAGWMQAVATFNPVTYVLEGLRSVVSSGWSARPLAHAFIAIAAVAALSMSLALAAFRARVTP